MTRDLGPALLMSKSSSFRGRNPIKSISGKLSKLTGKGSRKASQYQGYQDDGDDMSVDESVFAGKERIDKAKRRYSTKGQEPLDDESETSVRSSIYGSVMMDDMSEMSTRSERVAAATAKYGSLLMDDQSEKSTYSLLDKLEDARKNTKKKKKKTRETRLSKSLDLEKSLGQLNEKIAAQEKPAEKKRKVKFQKKIDYVDRMEDPGDWNDIFYSPAEIKKLKEEANELKKQVADGKSLDKNSSLRGLETKDPMAVSSFVAKVLDLQEKIWDASGHTGRKRLKHSDPEGLKDLASIMSHQASEDARKRGRKDETESKKVYAAMRRNKDEKQYLVEPRASSPVREILRSMSSCSPSRKVIREASTKPDKKESINRAKSMPLEKRKEALAEEDVKTLDEENHNDAEASKRRRRGNKSRSKSPTKTRKSRRETKSKSPSNSPKKSLSPPASNPPVISASKSPRSPHLKLMEEDDYRSLTMQERIARDKQRLEERRRESELLRKRRVLKEARRMKQDERDEKTRDIEKAKRRKERKRDEQRKKEKEEDRKKQEQKYLEKEEEIADDKRKKRDRQLRHGRKSKKPGSSSRSPRSLSPHKSARRSLPTTLTPLNTLISMGGSSKEFMNDDSVYSANTTGTGRSSRMGRRYRKTPVRRMQSDAARWPEERDFKVSGEELSGSLEELGLEQYEDYEEEL